MVELFNQPADAVGRLDVSAMRWWHARLCERGEQRRKEREAALRRLR